MKKLENRHVLLWLWVGMSLLAWFTISKIGITKQWKILYFVAGRETWIATVTRACTDSYQRKHRGAHGQGTSEHKYIYFYWPFVLHIGSNGIINVEKKYSV